VNRPPLLVEGPVYALLEGSISWARGAEGTARDVLLAIPIGARITLKTSSTTDNSWSLARGLGMQLHVAEANMLGLTFAVR
jgi:hypothetical protein